MKRSNEALAAGALADTDYQRQDVHSRELVDRAIGLQQSSNTMSAIEFLKSHDIDARLIERVLLEPHRRRASFAH